MLKKQTILKVLLAVICIILLVTLTGCSNKDEKEVNKDENNNKESEVQNVITIDRTADFDGETAVVMKTSNFVGTNYVIDKNFNVLCSYEGNSTYIDGYMQIQNKEKTKTNIVDVNGNIVFSYDDYEYKKVELVDDGCLILTKQTDTYNTSNTVTGIYSLQEQKYLVEPNEKYVNKIRTYGDDMLLLNDENTEFFNLKTKSIVKYSEYVPKEFKDGYSVEDDNDDYKVSYLKVFDSNGNIKRIKSPYPQYEEIFGKEHQNGMLFEITSYTYESDTHAGGWGIRTWCSIFDLESGESKDLSDEFWMVINKPHYTKDGLALVMFENKGGMQYYTIIDKQGNKLFEPQKVNDNKDFQPNDNGEPRKIVTEDLQEGNYFIVTDNEKYAVVDKNNKVILTAEDSEEFEGITNNTVKVKRKEQGKYDEYYYKNFYGNRIGIKATGEIKKCN